MQGFDGNGNPIYQYAGATMYPMPAPFNRIARIVYIAATDSKIYLAPFSFQGYFSPQVVKVIMRTVTTSTETFTPAQDIIVNRMGDLQQIAVDMFDVLNGPMQ